MPVAIEKSLAITACWPSASRSLSTTRLTVTFAWSGVYWTAGKIAGVAAGADERKKVERLCRYIARPAIAEGRLSLTTQGQARYTLKTPYRDGTTHVVFEPLDFMARLAAMVPRPRAHLTRYHGVFAPHSRWRAQVTPAGRGKLRLPDLRTPAERHRAIP